MKVLSGARVGVLLATILLSVLAYPVGAEEEPEKSDYESSEEFEKSKEDFGKQEEEKPSVDIRLFDYEKDKEEAGPQAPLRFGGWGGPLAGYLHLELGALDPMTHDRGLDRFDEGLVPVGGIGGFAYYPPDGPGWWYIGGLGFGVEQSVSDRIAGDDRRAKLTLGGGGIFIEYHQPVTSRLDLALGAMLGAGSITLKAEGDDLGLIDDDDFRASETFFIGYPYAGISYQPLKWLRVEAAAGWMFMTAGLDSSDFVTDDSGLDMTDGSVYGGPQVMLRVVFGYQL